MKVEIHKSDGTILWNEEHLLTTNNFGLVSFVVGTGPNLTGIISDFSKMDWNAQLLFLRTWVKYPITGSYTEMGTTQILSVPYSLMAKDVEGPIEKLDIKGKETSLDSALFEVKNNFGQTIFAVYNEGVRIYVDNGAKGAKGGFAVGGFDMAKGTKQTFMAISDDSVKIYIDSNPLTKKPKGGFAVGGYDMAKGGAIVQNYLDVNGDSIRMYIDKSSKAKKGGFAVGSFDMAKGNKNFLQVTTDSTRIYVSDVAKTGSLGGFAVKPQIALSAKTDFFNISSVPAAGIIKDESRVMWYPVKSALLAGEIYVPAPDSVGQYSVSLGYKNVAKGSYSQAMGYQSKARGSYSTAIGYEAVAGTNSFSFGRSTKATGYNSFAFGSKGVNSSGVEQATITEATGDYSFALGLGSKANGTGSFVMGTNCISSGNFATAAGFNSVASGLNSIAMGVNNTASAEVSFAMGSGNASSGQYSFSFGADNEAIGVASVALGLNNTAVGNQSIIGGFSNTGSGTGAFAVGSYNNVQGDGSIAAGTSNLCTGVTSSAFGSGNTSSGTRSFAIGNGTTASGTNAIAAGYQTRATGDNSLAIGYQDTTSGTGTFVSGYQTSARGAYSVALGYRTIARAYASFVIGRYNTFVTTSTAWNSTDQLFVAGNGTSAAAKNDALVLYKNGNMKLDGSFYPNDDGVPTLGLLTNKWAAVYALNGTIQTSDMRMKKDINDISYGLDAIMKLHPVSFRWIDYPDNGVRFGLLAQEVQDVINEVVDRGEDAASTLGLRYSEFIPVLIKGIQEQQTLINEQREKNTDLERKLDEITKRLEIIEKSK